jgi:hypothetical protein
VSTRVDRLRTPRKEHAEERNILNEVAARVRAIFALYLEYQALLPLVQELERRGWVPEQDSNVQQSS